MLGSPIAINAQLKHKKCQPARQLLGEEQHRKEAESASLEGGRNSVRTSAGQNLKDALALARQPPARHVFSLYYSEWSATPVLL